MTDIELLSGRARLKAAKAEAGFFEHPPEDRIRRSIDHTLLSAGTTADDVAILCDEAVRFGFASVCVPLNCVTDARRSLSGTEVKVSSVASFPLGASPIPVKTAEVRWALENGAEEMDVVLDIIRNPRFNNGDRKTGKSEKIQNLKTWGDQPFNTVYSKFLKSFYGEHPYSWLADGSVETVESLTRKDLIEWHQKTYIPNNMVFTIVGNVNPDEIIKKFEDTFGKLKKGKLPEKSSEPIPELDGDLVSVHPKNIQGAYLFLGYPAPEILNDDVPVMVLLNTILGGSGMNNRLYTELRDKQGLAYYVGSNYQPMVGPTSIFAIMVTAPENYRIARAGIVAEFKKFCDQPVSVKELEAAKKYIKGTFMMSQETSGAQGILLGLAELTGSGYGYLKRYPDLIEAVTPEDIQRVAQKYFKHYVLAVVAPEGSIEEQ